MTHSDVRAPHAQTPDWFHAALDVDVRTEVVHVGDKDIAVRRWGTTGAERSVLLIHGGTANSRWWDHVAPLIQAEVEVIAMDLSGHGDSSWAPAYSAVQWADEVAAVTTALDLAQPIVVGHSMGGIVALQTAQDHGARLGGVIVVDTFLAGTSASPPASPHVPRLRTGASRVEMMERFRLVPDAPALRFTRDHVAQHAVRERDGRWEWKFDPRILTSTLLDKLTSSPSPCPVRVVRGELGDMPMESLARLEELVGPLDRLTTVEDAGHHLMLDHPLELVEALRADLAGLQDSALSVR